MPTPQHRSPDSQKQVRRRLGPNLSGSGRVGQQSLSVVIAKTAQERIRIRREPVTLILTVGRS
jgi:hypothetical protein